MLALLSRIGIYTALEAIFLNLQQVSEELVQKCAELNRPRKQSSTTISGLYISGEAVSERYNELMASLASMTGARFNKAPMKGLVRMVEKLTLAVGEKNGKPELLCDVVRGTLECQDFQTMISAVQLLQELDRELCDTGEAGGIQERICICRAKNRFGQPTSGGWADFMVNFYFEEDDHKHICEVQFAHSQMLLVRQKMGGHAKYGQFRGALEILEVLGVDPEVGANAQTTGILKNLAWTRESSSSVAPGQTEEGELQVGVLQAKVETLSAQVEILEAKTNAQAEMLQLVLAKLGEVAGVKSDEIQETAGSVPVQRVRQMEGL